MVQLQRNPTAAKANAPFLFLLSAVWIVVSLTFSRVLVPSDGFEGEWRRPAFLAALLFAGFLLIARRLIPGRRALSSVGFVRRPTAAAELTLGLLLGWSIAVALMLPAVLTRHVQFSLDLTPGAWRSLLFSGAAVLLTALAVQLTFTGLAFRLLVESLGGATAALSVALLTLLLFLRAQPGQYVAGLVLVLASLLSSNAWLRTRALWLPLGIHVALDLALLSLFGMPVVSGAFAPAVIRNSFDGPTWLIGGDLGPETSILAVPVLLLALLVLFRTTRSYAWHYTYEPVTGAGHPMDIAPPAEHSRMEEATAARPVPLVQIVPASPKETSTTEM